MDIRKATPADLPAIMTVFEAARQTMKATGNPTQWGDSYPSVSLVAQDIGAGPSMIFYPFHFTA